VNPRAISSETLGPTLGGTIEIVNEKGYRGLRVKQHAASSTRNARSIWAGRFSGRRPRFASLLTASLAATRLQRSPR
jgi:hypothetical protein